MNIITIDSYILEYIFRFLSPKDVYILYETCKTIREVLIKFNFKRCKPTEEFVLKNKNNLNWAMSHPSFKFENNVFQLAIKYNNNDIIKYVYKIIKPDLNGTEYYSESIYNENFYIFNWLFKKGFTLDETAFDAAAKIGNLELLKFLNNKGCPWSNNTFNCSIYSGNLKCVQYLDNDNFPWNSTAYNASCETSNFEILKYLVSTSYNDLSRPWFNSSIFKSAARSGNVKILKFLKNKGCPWDIDATSEAFTYGNNKALEWLISNGCPVQQYILNNV